MWSYRMDEMKSYVRTVLLQEMYEIQHIIRVMFHWSVCRAHTSFKGFMEIKRNI